MKEEDEERLMEMFPQFDSFMLSSESLILTTYDNLKDVAESMGYDLDSEEFEDNIHYSDDDDDDDNNGGLLH